MMSHKDRLTEGDTGNACVCPSEALIALGSGTIGCTFEALASGLLLPLVRVHWGAFLPGLDAQASVTSGGTICPGSRSVRLVSG